MFTGNYCENLAIEMKNGVVIFYKNEFWLRQLDTHKGSFLVHKFIYFIKMILFMHEKKKLSKM